MSLNFNFFFQFLTNEALNFYIFLKKIIKILKKIKKNFKENFNILTVNYIDINYK